MHAISWFEIPVLDVSRAVAFYEALLDTQLQPLEMMGMQCVFLPADHQQGGIGGCLMKGPGYVPAMEGTLIYLPGGNDLTDVLSRVEDAGGQILLPKTAIGQNGFMAHFKDTEGNRIGLHSRH